MRLEMLDAELIAAEQKHHYRCPECGNTAPGSTWICLHFRHSKPSDPADYSYTVRPVKIEEG